MWANYYLIITHEMHFRILFVIPFCNNFIDQLFFIIKNITLPKRYSFMNKAIDRVAYFSTAKYRLPNLVNIYYLFWLTKSSSPSYSYNKILKSNSNIHPYSNKTLTLYDWKWTMPISSYPFGYKMKKNTFWKQSKSGDWKYVYNICLSFKYFLTSSLLSEIIGNAIWCRFFFFSTVLLRYA